MNDKQLVAEQAANKVKDGMLIGLGTGSTADYFIQALARRKTEENLRIKTVASSVVSTIKAKSLNLPLVAIEHIDHLDMYVDGADEVTPDLTVLKGRGSDLVKEKLLVRASDDFIVMVDHSKLVSRLSEKHPIPIEVMPFAWQLVKRALEAIGGEGKLRPNSNGDGLAVTSHGSLVLDMSFDTSLSTQTLNELLNDTPGIVEHGIFRELASTVLIGHDGQIEERMASG